MAFEAVNRFSIQVLTHHTQRELGHYFVILFRNFVTYKTLKVLT